MARHTLHLHSFPTTGSTDGFCAKDLLPPFTAQCSLLLPTPFHLSPLTLLTQSGLCSQHSMGKMISFAQYVKCVRDALLEAVKQYPQSFKNGELYSFMTKYFSVDFALDRISDHVGMRCISEIVCNVFMGVEVVYERSLGPGCTHCYGTFFPFLHSLSRLSVLQD